HTLYFLLALLFLIVPPPSRSTLFPYTTLFRSFSMPKRSSRFAAQSVENGCIVANVRLRVWIFDRFGTLKGSVHLRDRFVDMAEKPKGPRHYCQARCSSVLAGGSSSHSFGLVARIELLHGPFGQFAGFGDSPGQQVDRSHCARRVDNGRPISTRLGKAQQSGTRLVRLRQLAPHGKRHH